MYEKYQILVADNCDVLMTPSTNNIHLANICFLSEPNALFSGKTCPPGWVTRRDQKACYLVVEDLTRNWEGAENYCVSLEGHLVSIMNLEEQEEVEGEIL